MLKGKEKARGVGEIIANVGVCNGASVVTSSAADIVIGESHQLISGELRGGTYSGIRYRECAGQA